MIHLGVFLSRLRKLPALIFWLVKDVYRYFKNHEGKHFHQWGLHIYLGKFGAGKTCSMVRDAYFICKRYPDVTIITNLKLENFPEDTKILPLTCIQDILNAPDDTVVLIDETERFSIAGILPTERRRTARAVCRRSFFSTYASAVTDTL